MAEVPCWRAEWVGHHIGGFSEADTRACRWGEVLGLDPGALRSRLGGLYLHKQEHIDGRRKGLGQSAMREGSLVMTVGMAAEREQDHNVQIEN